MLEGNSRTSLCSDPLLGCRHSTAARYSATLNYIYTFTASSQPVRLEEWSCDDVASWLSGLRLEQYREIFQRNAIDGEELRNLTTESLHKDLGIGELSN